MCTKILLQFHTLLYYIIIPVTMWCERRLAEPRHSIVKESWPQPNSPSVDHLANRQPIHLVRTPIPVKQSCWGDCQVCGDRATGKHYGVIACEGCKGFFKRSVRKKLIYTCRAKGSCVIDKLQRNRCQRCRLEKCFKAGMNQDAVQCERKPLITSTLSTPTSHAIVGDRNKCFHSVESSPSEILMPVTPPSSLPDVPSPSYPSQETSSILGPQHSEFRLYIPNLAVPDFSMDYIYEFATRLLFVSVDWCRSISTFRSLRKADQVALLKRSWPEIFLLGVVQLIEKFPFSPLFAFAASDLKKEKDQKHEGYPKCQQSIFNNIMIVKNFVFGFARMELDPMEFAYVKAIVLFNSDPHIPVADPKHIENLQEQTHCAFKRYMDTKHPLQPERFARVLLKLPSIRSIDRSIVEDLFFVPLIGTVRVADIMDNIVSQTKEF